MSRLSFVLFFVLILSFFVSIVSAFPIQPQPGLCPPGYKEGNCVISPCGRTPTLTQPVNGFIWSGPVPKKGKCVKVNGGIDCKPPGFFL